jgi:hypothetical protein
MLRWIQAKCSRPQNHEAMVYWAAVFIMTRRLTRYENREILRRAWDSNSAIGLDRPER